MRELEEYLDGLFWYQEDGSSWVLGFTQKALDGAGALSGAEVSDLGDELSKGDWIAEVRGKNSVVEMVAPWALRILEHNREVIEQPSLLEDDPTGDAWVLRVEKL